MRALQTQREAVIVHQAQLAAANNAFEIEQDKHNKTFLQLAAVTARAEKAEEDYEFSHAKRLRALSVLERTEGVVKELWAVQGNLERQLAAVTARAEKAERSVLLFETGARPAEFVLKDLEDRQRLLDQLATSEKMHNDLEAGYVRELQRVSKERDAAREALRNVWPTYCANTCPSGSVHEAICQDALASASGGEKACADDRCMLHDKHEQGQEFGCFYYNDAPAGHGKTGEK